MSSAMKTICYLALPFVKEEVTLALESGIDTLIVPAEHKEQAQSLARCTVISTDEIALITLATKADEEQAAMFLSEGKLTILEKGWEIIPVENLLAHEEALLKKGQARLALIVTTSEEATLALGILEKGVSTLIIPPVAIHAIKDIVNSIQDASAALPLQEATITEITPVGMGHRVCVDTLSLLTSGQGMLVGNSAAFTFLVNAETERNEYVASRPFRINAGAVHAYAMMPIDTTRYLEELQAGSEILVVDHTGKGSTATVGRAKIERRPMLLIKAKSDTSEGTIFLQNAETIRLVTPDGTPVSVVSLAIGDRVLCHLDTAGRHFGMRISESISEE